ncbi:MAG: isoprenoid biosynthesis glyoxalase ElbB [Phycisphaerales bacterium]|nr:isoprenoid biosynthesis glyoxalase ElbB [Phycisphaerales bacterium]
MNKVGVILSGCGVFDGSEIQEASATLIALAQRSVEYQCMAPDCELEVIDHLSQQPTGEKRNVLTESARIARGDILNLKDVKGDQFDAFLLPGGFGAAKNLCNFATKGADCTVNPEVERVLNEANQAGKPIGFICIAPAIGAKVFGDKCVKLTIGHDPETTEAINATGAVNVGANADEIVIDDSMNIVSTPAYMEATNPAQVFAGISELVENIVERING